MATSTRPPPRPRRTVGPWAAVAAACCVLAPRAAAGQEPPSPLSADMDTPGRIDWTLRRIVAEGVGLAPDTNDGLPARRRASEKMARAHLVGELLARVAELQVEGTGSAGQAGAQMAASPQLHRAVVQRLGRAREVAARYFSDGGVSLRAALSLEAVADLFLQGPAGARHPHTPPAVEAAGGFTGLAIDAHLADFPPRLRVVVALPGGRVIFDAASVRGEEASMAGPVAFVRDSGQALRQARLGARPMWRSATLMTDPAGERLVLTEDIAAGELAALLPLMEQGRVVVVW